MTAIETTVNLAQIAEALKLDPALLHELRQSGAATVKVRLSDIIAARRQARDLVAAAEKGA